MAMSSWQPRPVASRAQRQQDVEHGRIAAAGDVRDQRGRHHRRAVRTRPQVEQTGLGQIVQIVRRDLRLGPALTVAGDRAIDQARVGRGQRGIAEAKAVHDAGPELLDQHVGGADQRHQARCRALRLEVERDAALAAIEQGKAGARRAEPGLVATQLVAVSGPLDLDHLGAGLGQDQAGERSGQQRAEVNDLDAGEWLHGCSIRSSVQAYEASSRRRAQLRALHKSCCHPPVLV
jgi:hypothetical protein